MADKIYKSKIGQEVSPVVPDTYDPTHAVNLGQVREEVAGASVESISEWQYFLGDGTKTAFTVTGEVLGIVLVEIDGRIQVLGTNYSVSGSTITFTSAPFNGAIIGVLKGTLAPTTESPTTGSPTINEGNIWRPALSETDTAQQTADKINNAIISAGEVDGVVILPAGKFISRTINWLPNVLLKGSGMKATQLTSVAAEPLISYTGNTVHVPSANIENMTLYGGVNDATRIGTTALQLQRVAFFHHKNLMIKFFTGYPIDLTGVLIGEFSHVHIRSCFGGVNAINAETSSEGGLQANLVIFRNCSWTYVPDWSIKWAVGASVQFISCDWELSGGATTGLIKFTQASPSNEGIGMIIDKCWGERNSGNAFYFSGYAGATHIIRSSMFQYNTHGKFLELDGGKCFIETSTFKNTSGSAANYIINGDLETLASNIGSVSLLNASTHKTYQPVTV